MKPLCVDLFCGYGGWARGFIDAGYDVIGVDNDTDCVERYPSNFIWADMRSTKGNWFTDIQIPRVVVASPPCNYYSKLSLPKSWGKNWKEDDGGELWKEAERVIREINP